MRRLMLLVATLAGCTRGIPTPLPPNDQLPARMAETPGGMQVWLSSGLTKPNGVIIPAPPEKVWPAALEAYRWVGLRVDALDTAAARVETRNMRVQRKLGTQYASDLFDCGSNIFGPIADHFTLSVNGQMAVGRMTVDGDSLNSVVGTIFTIQGVESQTGVATCTSRGKLEQLMEKRIRETLGLEAAGR